MILRSYRPSDLDTLYQIDQSCFPPGVSYSRDEIERFIGSRRSQAWIAEEGQEIAGFLIAGRERNGTAHIVTIDVAERWRRRAVGTMLMDAAEEWAQVHGLRLVYLETAEDNVAAQAFYTKRRYEKLKKVERYYANGAAAWVMVKWL